ncbi:Regulator of G-protein signaling 9-binding protein [Dirofilaria immitis]
MACKLRQHSLSSVRKLQELVHDSNVQLAQFRNVVQYIGTGQDGLQLRNDIDSFGRACIKSCEAAKSCILPQLRHEGVEFTRHASQFIGCVNACVVEMRRCAALEHTFPNGEPCITQQQIEHMEEMLETLENLITVHYSTSESSPAERVTPRRRRATNCRPACVCSKLKTSYAYASICYLMRISIYLNASSREIEIELIKDFALKSSRAAASWRFGPNL